MLRACTECGDVDVISFCTDSEPDRSGYHVIYHKHTLVKTSDGGRMKKFRHLLTLWNPATLFNAKNGSLTVRNRLYHRLFCFSLKIGLNAACRKCGIAFFSNIGDIIKPDRVFLPNAPLSYDYDNWDAG